MKINYKLYHYNYYFFNTLLAVVWFFSFLVLLGVNIIKPQYVDTISYIIRIYVCLFLLLRFNPIYNLDYTGKNTNFSEFDKQLAFTAAVIVLTTDTNFIKYLNNIFKLNDKSKYGINVLQTFLQEL